MFKALSSAALFILINVAQSNVAKAETNPFDPPISCSGKYYCTGESWYRGEVGSNGRFWNQALCFQNLQSQVTQTCSGAAAQVAGVTYTNHNQPEGSAECPRHDPYYDYFVTIAAPQVSRGGYGGSVRANQQDSINSAFRQCEKQNNGCSVSKTAKNGCVTLVVDPYGQSTFSSGCSADQSQNSALTNCFGCRVIKTYCTWSR